MAITPDPGVLEVNVPPVASWRQQVSQCEFLYDQRHQLHFNLLINLMSMGDIPERAVVATLSWVVLHPSDSPLASQARLIG